MQDTVLIQQSSFAAIHLLLQTGASPSHSPLVRHLRVRSPTRSNPLLQLYVALEPGTLELGRSTSPFAGSGRLGHTIPACKTQFGYCSHHLQQFTYSCRLERLLPTLHWSGTCVCGPQPGQSHCCSCMSPWSQGPCFEANPHRRFEDHAE